MVRPAREAKADTAEKLKETAGTTKKEAATNTAKPLQKKSVSPKNASAQKKSAPKMGAVKKETADPPSRSESESSSESSESSESSAEEVTPPRKKPPAKRKAGNAFADNQDLSGTAPKRKSSTKGTKKGPSEGASPAGRPSKNTAKTPTKAAPKAAPKKVKTPPKVNSEAGPSNAGPPAMGEPNQRMLRVNSLFDNPFRDVPANSVLIDSCDCMGSWAGAIGTEFKTKYPNAYQAYKSHCEASTPAALLGTALLVQPGEGDPSHWVACLFVTKQGGAAHDPKDEILSNTESSMRDLLQHLHRQEVANKMSFSELRMPKITSETFGVPWLVTKAMLQRMVLSDGPVREGVGDGDTLIKAYGNTPMRAMGRRALKGKKKKADKPSGPPKPKKKQKKN